MIESAVYSAHITRGVAGIAKAATELMERTNGGQLSVSHWIVVLIGRHAMMVDAMLPDPNFSAKKYGARLRRKLRRDSGRRLGCEQVFKLALARAATQGKQRATESDLAFVVLSAAGFRPVDNAFYDALISFPEQLGTSETGERSTSRKQPPPPAPKPYVHNARVSAESTPTLNQLGRDLTQRALQGRLSPVVGRQNEIQLMMETLCRHTKRNPLLVGPAGTGKTAIVEGLAQRIVRGEVPAALRGVRIIDLQIASLMAGTDSVGDLEKRVQPLLAEAAQDGILLFIDEVHTMVGAGAYRNNDNDIAQMLKPAMARGDVAVIGATTDGEYRHYIQKDAALERRFQPIRVQELSAEECLEVLVAVRNHLCELRKVEVADELLRRIIAFARQYLPNRHFPDKAVDLLEQCIAHAILHGKSRVEAMDAEAVVRRMLGMPLDVAARMKTLRDRLDRRSLLGEVEAEALVNRLEVSMRGMDLNSDRPNAVALLVGDAATSASALAESLADSLYGAADRVITIDIARYADPGELPLLLGGQQDSRPEGTAPLQRLTQTPWCVLLLQNVHACHWQVREFLRQVLADGSATDAKGKRLYLSDTIVLLTATLERGGQASLGFQSAAPASESRWLRDKLAAELGAEFMAEVDFVFHEVPVRESAHRSRIEEDLLPGLASRYREHGITLRWNDGLVDWMLRQADGDATLRDWERIVDERLSPLLLSYIPAAIETQVEIDIEVDGKGLRVSCPELDLLRRH